MSAHTPGPWVVRFRNVETPERRNSENGGWSVAEVYGPDSRANARLIAAAPDLLEALRETLWMAEKWAEAEHRSHPAREACESAAALLARLEDKP